MLLYSPVPVSTIITQNHLQNLLLACRMLEIPKHALTSAQCDTIWLAAPCPSYSGLDVTALSALFSSTAGAGELFE